jgi:CubicO group peptidase (beta-lactamase class C family)
LARGVDPAGVTIDERTRYGRHWYLGEVPVTAKSGQRSEHWVGAFGNGGQRLYVVPGLELAVVITAATTTSWVRDRCHSHWRAIVWPSLTVD